MWFSLALADFQVRSQTAIEVPAAGVSVLGISRGRRPRYKSTPPESKHGTPKNVGLEDDSPFRRAGVIFGFHVSFLSAGVLITQLNQSPTESSRHNQPPTHCQLQSHPCFLHIFNQGFTRFGQTRMDLWRDSWPLFFFRYGPLGFGDSWVGRAIRVDFNSWDTVRYW